MSNCPILLTKKQFRTILFSLNCVRFTEKRIFVNKLKFPNGFVVNTPKMNYLDQEVGEEGEDLDGIKKEEPNQELLEVEPELALENQDIHMHDFDYEALKSEGEDDIGLDYVFLIFSQFFSDFLS